MGVYNGSRRLVKWKLSPLSLFTPISNNSNTIFIIVVFSFIVVVVVVIINKLPTT